MIGIIDYGVGNLFSLISSLKYLGLKSVVVADKAGAENCDRLILPGVGAFGDAMEKLRQNFDKRSEKRKTRIGNLPRHADAFR